MVPFQPLAQIEHGEYTKHHQRNNLLEDFKLGGRVHGIPPPVGRHLQAILEEGDAPACQDHNQERLGFVFQMPVPGDGHEEI